MNQEYRVQVQARRQGKLSPDLESEGDTRMLTTELYVSTLTAWINPKP